MEAFEPPATRTDYFRAAAGLGANEAGPEVWSATAAQVAGRICSGPGERGMSGLRTADLAMFAKLGIPEELLRQAGVERVTDKEARENYGIRGGGDMAGIAFPYYAPATMANGKRRWYVRIRRDFPETENGQPKRKYMAPYGDRKHLYFPPVPALFADVAVPIILVEAEKSSLALTAWMGRTGSKVLPIALGGCYGWKGKIGIKETATGERVPNHGAIPDLNICRDGRRIYVLLDGNVSVNPLVQAARRDLMRQLQKQGADTYLINLPRGPWNGPDDYIAAKGDKAMAALLDAAQKPVDLDDWRSLFHTYEESLNAPPLRFAIEGFLQQEAITIIGGLAGHGKTMLMLNMVKSMLEGLPLFNYFPFQVTEVSKRVLYLVPESGIGPFVHRLKLFNLLDHVCHQKLFYRTLNAKEPMASLGDPRILEAAEGADVFLDTAIRFMEGDENSAADQRQFAQVLFNLQQAGARTIVGAHHSPKNLGHANFLTLENVLRGSGDIGAMIATCWGVFQTDVESNTLVVKNVKPRDFEPCAEFRIEGRPWLEEKGYFQIVRLPEKGKSSTLSRSEPNRVGARRIRKKMRSWQRRWSLWILALLLKWLRSG